MRKKRKRMRTRMIGWTMDPALTRKMLQLHVRRVMQIPDVGFDLKCTSSNMTTPVVTR